MSPSLVAKADEYGWSSARRPERPLQPQGLPHPGSPCAKPRMYRLQWQVLSPPSIPLSNPPAARLILPKRPVRPGEDLVRFPHGGALEPLPDQRRGRATRYRALPARIRACGTTAHRPACCPRLPGTEAGTGSTRRCSLWSAPFPPHRPPAFGRLSTSALRRTSHDSGAGWVAKPCPVRLFHSQLHAGLSRRYPGGIACPAWRGLQSASESCHGAPTLGGELRSMMGDPGV